MRNSILVCNVQVSMQVTYIAFYPKNYIIVNMLQNKSLLML